MRWLEEYLAVSVGGLKNKTKVKDYWKAEVGWEGLLSALAQNRKAIQSAKGIDITHREPFIPLGQGRGGRLFLEGRSPL